jgi:hypothetical protein
VVERTPEVRNAVAQCLMLAGLGTTSAVGDEDGETGKKCVIIFLFTESNLLDNNLEQPNPRVICGYFSAMVDARRDRIPPSGKIKA